MVLQESLLTTDEEKIKLSGFSSWNSPAKKYRTKKWASGGLTVLAKAELDWQGQELVLGDDSPHYLAVKSSYESSEMVLLNIYLLPQTFSPNTWENLKKTVLKMNSNYLKSS